MNDLKELISKSANGRTFDKDLILTEEEIVELSNQDVGDLDKEDGINCPICKNKGFIYYLKDGYRTGKRCTCYKARKSIRALKESNINADMLQRFTFENFKVESEWQNKLKQKCINYVENIKNGNNDWLVISSVSGSGKTHLATAIFQTLIREKYFDGEYLLWNDFISKIIPMSKSVMDTQQIKYEETMERLANIDILYIDDMLKLSESKYNNDNISMLYKIINQRYINNKITIITTEFYPEEIEEKDVATCGRINEKCNFGKWWLVLKRDPSRNYRMKKREEF